MLVCFNINLNGHVIRLLLWLSLSRSPWLDLPQALFSNRDLRVLTIISREHKPVISLHSLSLWKFCMQLHYQWMVMNLVGMGIVLIVQLI